MLDKNIVWGNVMRIAKKSYDVFVNGYWSGNNFVKGYGSKANLVEYFRSLGLKIDDIRVVE